MVSLSLSGASLPDEPARELGPVMCEPLLSFIPAGLLARIHGARERRPAAITLPAAVMFVDVSRYTALVERYANLGDRGLEKIPVLIGQSFVRCVDRICDSGGEVLWLAGDTLVGYWPGDRCRLGDAVRAAAKCADQICSGRIVTFDVESGDIAPALHVGIGAGELWAAALGGDPMWNLLAAGEAVIEAANALSVALPWEYVLSDHAKQAFELAPEPRSAEKQSFPSVHSADTAWMAEFLPPQLRNVLSGVQLGAREERIESRRAGDEELDIAIRFDTFAELRPVTVLFARIGGLDHRGPNALMQHHLACSAFQHELRARGGPAGELIFDDKGLVFMAVFGAHGCFHRDDASRAVHAALGIAASARRLNLSVSVGVATGGALFRVIGNDRRRQLMVVGAPVNRAARLMAEGSAGPLCDAPTERASRTAFRFENCGTLQLKGVGQTTATFRPVAERVANLSPAVPIGRQSELETLTLAFEEVKGNGRRSVVVTGEPGIGKTTLVTAFAEHVRASGSAVAVACAEREDRQTSLLPWRRVLACLFALDPAAGGREVFAAIEMRFRGNEAIQTRLPLLADLLGFETVQGEATRHLIGAHRADATMRLVADVIGWIARSPMVIVLEDSQWLDSASWRLVEWVSASVQSLLLILCVRSDEVPDELNSLIRRAAALRMNSTIADINDPARFLRVLDLKQLDSKSIGAIVARTLHEASLDPDVARHVTELAGGNPLFAEEITLTLKSEGLIAVRDGSWRPIRSLDEFRYFDGVDRAIRERVDRLHAKAQVALKAATIIGRTFSSDALAVLLRSDMDRPAVLAAVGLLASAQLVHPAAEPGRYEFRHNQIRDVIYSSIPGDVRRRLHGIFADWLETEVDVAGYGDIAVLVQHFEAAGNHVKAVKYADLAATQSLRTGAFREVRSFLQICIGHEPRQQAWTTEQKLRAVRWRRQLGEAHYGLGDIHGQGLAVRRALTLAGLPVPTSSAELAQRFISSGLHLALQELFPHVPVKSDHNWEQELTRCFKQAAAVDYFELRFARAFCHTVSAVTHAERTGLSSERALTAALLAVALGIFGWRRAAQHFIARAEKAAATLQDPAIHSQVCHLDALWRVGHADWPAVDERLNRAQDLCLAAGDNLTWCNAQVLRFWSQFYRGELDALERTAQGLLSRAQNSGNVQQEVWALRCKALCALYSDRPRDAVDFLRLSTSASRGSADLSDRVSSLGALALSLSRTGLRAESVQAAVEALALLGSLKRPTVYNALQGLAGIVEVFLRGREYGMSVEYDQWSRWEAQALNELKSYSRMFPIGAAQYGLWAGVAHWLDGRRARAMSRWNEALQISQRLSLRLDESLIAAEIRRRQI